MIDPLIQEVFSQINPIIDDLFRDVSVAGPPQDESNLSLEDYDHLFGTVFTSDFEADRVETVVRNIRTIIYDLHLVLLQATEPVQFYNVPPGGPIHAISKSFGGSAEMCQIRLLIYYNEVDQGLQCSVDAKVKKGAIPEEAFA